MKRDEANRYQRRLRRDANRRIPQPATRTNVWGGLVGDVAGVKVVTVPVKKADG